MNGSCVPLRRSNSTKPPRKSRIKNSPSEKTYCTTGQQTIACFCSKVEKFSVVPAQESYFNCGQNKGGKNRESIEDKFKSFEVKYLSSLYQNARICTGLKTSSNATSNCKNKVGPNSNEKIVQNCKSSTDKVKPMKSSIDKVVKSCKALNKYQTLSMPSCNLVASSISHRNSCIEKCVETIEKISRENKCSQSGKNSLEELIDRCFQKTGTKCGENTTEKKTCKEKRVENRTEKVSCCCKAGTEKNRNKTAKCACKEETVNPRKETVKCFCKEGTVKSRKETANVCCKEETANARKESVNCCCTEEAVHPSKESVNYCCKKETAKTANCCCKDECSEQASCCCKGETTDTYSEKVSCCCKEESCSEQVNCCCKDGSVTSSRETVCCCNEEAEERASCCCCCYCCCCDEQPVEIRKEDVGSIKSCAEQVEEKSRYFAKEEPIKDCREYVSVCCKEELVEKQIKSCVEQLSCCVEEKSRYFPDCREYVSACCKEEPVEKRVVKRSNSLDQLVKRCLARKKETRVVKSCKERDCGEEVVKGCKSAAKCARGDSWEELNRKYRGKSEKRLEDRAKTDGVRDKANCKRKSDLVNAGCCCCCCCVKQGEIPEEGPGLQLFKAWIERQHCCKHLNLKCDPPYSKKRYRTKDYISDLNCNYRKTYNLDTEQS